MSTPVCSTCQDTHEMTIHRPSGDEQTVMCTRCPRPCDRCRQGAGTPGVGLGPYCATTPCACDCHHGGSPAVTPLDPARQGIWRVLQAARDVDDLLQVTALLVAPKRSDWKQIQAAGVRLRAELAGLDSVSKEMGFDTARAPRMPRVPR
jgi:hypothetical protein